jgi:ATP-binding cassette, subfamily C (CFTR/MRP), member 1
MGTKENGAGIKRSEYKVNGITNDHEGDPLIWKGENNPYEKASWWNKLVFGWLSPLLELGNAKGQLDKEDLGILPFPDAESTVRVRQVFEASWETEVQNGKANDRDPSLVRALWFAFYSDFCKAGILKFVHDLLQFVGPQVLNRLIKFIRDAEAPLSRGLGLTAIVTLAQLFMSLCLRHYFFKCYRVGIRIRTAVIASVYQKAFKVSSTTKSTGEITNLMSVDAQRLQEVVTYAHSVWYSPLQ